MLLNPFEQTKALKRNINPTGIIYESGAKRAAIVVGIAVTAPEMLDHVRATLALFKALDIAKEDRRIRPEAASRHGAQDLEGRERDSEAGSAGRGG